MAKHRKQKRRILKAKISFLSLCPRGMNQIQTLYKSDDGNEHSIALATIVKDGMSEQGEITAVVYAPEIRDGEGDVASAEVIKEFAYDYAANGQGIDIRHNEEVLSAEDAFIAETFIVQKGDPRFVDIQDYEGNSVDVTGGWGVVIKVDNEGIRQAYREGKWGGISMGGLALKQNENSETSIAHKLLEIIKELRPYKKKSENEMTDKEQKEMTDRITKNVLEVLTKAEEAKAEKLKKEAETRAKAEADKKSKLGLGLNDPVLKDNPSDEDIDQHEKNVMIVQVSKAVDSTDPDSIRAFQKIKKDILEGKEVTIDKQGNDKKPYDAFTTNQATSEVRKGFDSQADDDIGNAILADMEKEEKAAVKLSA